MPVTEQTFKQLALEDPEGHWEMYCGVPRQKPGMTAEHNDLALELSLSSGASFSGAHSASGRMAATCIGRQRTISSRISSSCRATWSSSSEEPGRSRSMKRHCRLSSRSGRHRPAATTLRSSCASISDAATSKSGASIPMSGPSPPGAASRDGGYTEIRCDGGTVQPVALPGVTIDLDALFA